MRRSALAVGVSVLALAATLIPPAQAHRPRDPEVVTGGLVGPLTLAVGDRGDVFVTQTFANTLSRVDRRGEVTTVHQLAASPEEGELVGVTYHRGSTYHIETDYTGEVPTSHIVRTTRSGTRTVVSDDLVAHELEHNPDAGKTYGFRNLRTTCANELLALEEAIGAPIGSEYTGIVESHAYQLEVHRGSIYVADAAANAVLEVDRRTGEISTVAVLPSTTITFTAELEAALEAMMSESLGEEVDLPDCLVGRRYTPEPVPTDVAVGRGGMLYVSTLEGGAGEIVPLSKVYRVNPWNGRARAVAGGMHGATGLDVTRDGHVVVAEMFGGEVSVVHPHHRRPTVRTLFAADSPADVDVAGRTVYATTGTFGEGALVSYRLRGR